MKDIVREYQAFFRQRRKEWRRYTALLLALAFITTLFVNWQLHSDGIAITAQYQCGQEEHQHTAECYTRVLVCGYEEGEPEDGTVVQPDTSADFDSSFGVDTGAVSAAQNYDVPEYIYVPHEHTDACYQEVKTLTCWEEEHQHTDDCFDPEDGSLICDEFEHTHDDSCYTTEYELVCGLEDGELVEELNPDYLPPVADFEVPVDNTPVVVEPVYEAPVHHHTDDCYEEVLTCGLEEHHHTVNCLADPLADVEDEADWLSKTDTSLTGLWNEDLLTVAKSQLGYEQSEKNFELDADDGATVRHYTRYGQWYGNPYGEWDVMFLSYCLNYAGVPQSAIPQRAGTLALRSDLRPSGYLVDADSVSTFSADPAYTAEDLMPGDIVFYNTTSTETVAVEQEPQVEDLSPDADTELLQALNEPASAEPQTEQRTVSYETVGIVSAVDETGALTVISGNVDGKVAEVSLQLSQLTGVIPVASVQAAESGADTVEDDARQTVTPTEDKHDFTENIEKVEMNYRKSYGSWQPITDGCDLDENDEIQVSMEYTIPAGTLSETCNTITYTLPEALSDFEESGTVYDTDGKAVGYGTVKDGKVEVTFYDSYVKSNAEGTPISGKIVFDGKAELVKVPLDQETTLKFNDSCSSTIKINQGQNQRGDLHTEKSYTDYDLENGTVKYTVRIWSNHGTAGNPIDLDDAMQNFVLDTDKGFTVTKSDDTTVDIADLTYKDGSAGFTGQLPALGADESYTLTYWGKLPDDLKGGNVTAQNTIHAESKNSRGDKIESSSSVSTSFTNVKKSGVYNEDEGTVTWTVTLNESHTDLSGWVLKDELNGEPYTGTVTITPSNGAPFEADLPYTFGTNSEDTTSSFTITYTTPADHEYGTSDVKNKATLSKGDSDGGKEMGSADSSVNVGSKDAYTKEGLGYTENDDGTLTLTWHIKLIIYQDLASGWRWTDTPYGEPNQYFTPENRQQLAEQLDELLGAGNYTMGDAYNPGTTGDVPGNWTSLGIEGKIDLKKGTVLEFNVDTTVAKRPDVFTTIWNNCSFNGTGFRGKNDYTPSLDSIVKKFDATADGTVTDHDYHDSKQTLTWKIEVTMTDSFLSAGPDSFTITDTIPAGLEFQQPSLTGEGWNTSGTSATATGWNINTWYWDRNVWGSTGSGPAVPAAITKNADGSSTMTVEIPKALYEKVTPNSKITLLVPVKITEDPAAWDSTQKNYTNEVSVTDSTGKDWGSDRQTQEVYYNKHHDSVKKSGRQVDESEASNTVEYTVVVNESGETILDDASIPLTLTDRLQYTYNPWGSKLTVSLVPGSVHVYHYDPANPDDRSRELSLAEYSYLYETQGYGNESAQETRTNQLTFTLPNAEPLLVVYRYKAGSPNSWEVNESLNNSAELSADKKIITSTDTWQTVKVTNSSFTADIHGITVYKVDAENNGLYLAGAKFSLYKWDGTDWALVTDQFTTDNSGMLKTTDGKSLSTVMDDNQVYNQAYKLVETQAPSGYKLPDEENAYLFYIPSTNKQTYPEYLPADQTGLHTHSSGQTIYLPNARDDTPSYELPSTGGAGTTPYTAVGGAIALAALVCGLCQKRRRERRAHN